MSEGIADLSGRVALVTGASRGIGKGIALELGAAGATVYVTGRTVEEGAAPLPGTIGATADEVTRLGGQGIAVQCDHAADAQVEAVVAHVKDTSGKLDVLVNNVFSVPEKPVFESKFWELPVSFWDRMLHVGCRAHYVAAVAATPMMVERGSGLIVNISSFAGGAYVFNVAYGVGKAAVDRMARDMAVELQPYGVACVSLWPGVVRTEYMVESHRRGDVPFSLEKGESPRFTGRAVVALAADPDKMKKTGHVIPVVDLATEYGFKDVDGRAPGPMIEQMGF